MTLASIAVRDVMIVAKPMCSRPRSAASSGLTSQNISGCSSDRRSEEHTSELQSHSDLVCRLLLEKKKRHNPTDHAWISNSTRPHAQYASTRNIAHTHSTY